MKRNDQVYGVCSGYTHDGHGVVKIDGFPLFVKDMLEGEAGELVVTMAKKKFGYGRLMKRSKTSSQRVAPPVRLQSSAEAVSFSICPMRSSCGLRSRRCRM
ncbi:MAG: hypothetical protein ACLRY6_09715 [[Clostridium] innocuum]